MWILHTNGQKLKVVNEDHIKRLLSEGGQEIPDPTLPQEPAVEQMQAPESDKSAEQIVKPAQSAKKPR